ncbi:unnamed protein product [Timema podura]|uniref:Uncharacterized protein n=1 Tax=Timema podura TaxID=61482 RepID=A0ABN7NWI7_TIMPD|nr:unnamed protein product [Timema podura]
MTRATWLLLIGCLLLQVHCAYRPGHKSRSGDPFDSLPNNFWLEFSSPFTESYDELTELEVTTTPEPLPFFEDAANSTNVTTQLGSSVFLHCRVNDLRDKTLSCLFEGHPFELRPKTSKYLRFTSSGFSLLLKDKRRKCFGDGKMWRRVW